MIPHHLDYIILSILSLFILTENVDVFLHEPSVKWAIKAFCVHLRNHSNLWSAASVLLNAVP